MTTAPIAPAVTATPIVNIAARVSAAARAHPDKPAVIACRGMTRDGRTRYRSLTFAQLERSIDAYARGFQHAGITRGMRTIVMIKPGHEFFAVTFALFKLGAVPVLIDPGMGRRKLIDCLAEVEAEAFIGIPLAHVARKLFARAFRTVRVRVTVGRRWAWGGPRLADLHQTAGEPAAPADTRGDDVAAILFTSGSTGPAKGVVYTHGIFDAQVTYLESQYGYRAEEVDLATFPLFALFDAALGMTAVLPEMDPTRPAEIDPVKIVAAIRDHHVTHMFGSPALLNRLSRYLAARGERLDAIKRVMTAGAPVPTAVLARMRTALPADADIFTPYGATEALPIASIESREILAETADQTRRGAGICVGRPLPEIDARIIAIDDAPIAAMDADQPLPVGDVGEICVRGPVVTTEYFRKPEGTARAKIRDGATIWHRMGDVGYLDSGGRLWFCGRKAHRVQTAHGVRFTICVEAIINEHPAILRSALVGIGAPPAQIPVLCVELEAPARRADPAQLRREILARCAEHELTRDIAHVLFHPAFPVDVRHNAKIFREQLAVWAARRIQP
jgi:acyl-CoA synthetase (AMP-forming)/AMP-acid ligase II